MLVDNSSKYLNKVVHKFAFSFLAAYGLLAFNTSAAFHTCRSVVSKHSIFNPNKDHYFCSQYQREQSSCRGLSNFYVGNVQLQIRSSRNARCSTKMINQGSEPGTTYQVKVLRSINEVTEDDWNACAFDAAGAGKENPFVSWAFFKALEDSKSAVREVGWAPTHIAVK